ncbi:unnamed protein product [Lepidochelys kempii]
MGHGSEPPAPRISGSLAEAAQGGQLDGCCVMWPPGAPPKATAEPAPQPFAMAVTEEGATWGGPCSWVGGTGPAPWPFPMAVAVEVWRGGPCGWVGGMGRGSGPTAIPYGSRRGGCDKGGSPAAGWGERGWPHGHLLWQSQWRCGGGGAAAESGAWEGGPAPRLFPMAVAEEGATRGGALRLGGGNGEGGLPHGHLLWQSQWRVWRGGGRLGGGLRETWLGGVPAPWPHSWFAFQDR